MIFNKTIYFIRHGETDMNRQRIVQGSGVDSNLNDLGHAQAQAFYRQYQDIDFDLLICSKLRRTHQTIAPFINDQILLERYAEINEMNWGVHEGQSSTEEMRAAYRRMIQAWQDGDFSARLEDGESAQELANRLSNFLEILKHRPEKTILVCTHGRAMLCLLALMNQQHLREMENYKHTNTGLYLFHLEEGIFKMKRVNDSSHLSSINIE